jgi:hypothetical protein
MNNQLPCDAQDMLEAAIVQRRRIDITWQKSVSETAMRKHVLAIDIATESAKEWLTLLVADESGGIERLRLNTARLLSFQANDEQQPIIRFQRKRAC